MINRTFVKIDNEQIVLHISTDSYGRVQSRIVKNGKVLAVDIYVRVPTVPDLEKQGWTIKPS